MKRQPPGCRRRGVPLQSRMEAREPPLVALCRPAPSGQAVLPPSAPRGYMRPGRAGREPGRRRLAPGIAQPWGRARGAASTGTLTLGRSRGYSWRDWAAPLHVEAGGVGGEVGA